MVPNVFDFDNNRWEIDDFNRDFRERLGIGQNDLLILQATRIVPRKGIELAIDFTAGLSRHAKVRKWMNSNKSPRKNKIYLVLAGLNEMDDYYEKLKTHARKKKVELLYINHMTGHSRSAADGAKTYSLWDVYVHADLITYPSLLEGWGNQFIEGVNARKPLVVFEYPVFKVDIKPLGFRYISMGSRYHYRPDGLVEIPPEVLDDAVDHAATILVDKKMQRQWGDDNYEIAREKLSYSMLTALLKNIFS